MDNDNKENSIENKSASLSKTAVMCWAFKN